MTTTRKTAASAPTATSASGGDMRVNALRISLLACAVVAAGLFLDAAPLLWLSVALMVVGLIGIVAALAGVTL